MFSFLRRSSTPEIDVDELDRLIEAGTVRILDVREDHEFARGHVVGAVHIPVKRLPDRLGKLKRDKRYAVICASGIRGRGLRPWGHERVGAEWPASDAVAVGRRCVPDAPRRSGTCRLLRSVDD
jgi:hypothetical protein